MNLNKLGTYLLGSTVALLLMAANAAAQPVQIFIVVNTVGGDGTFAFTDTLGNYTVPSVITSGGTGGTSFFVLSGPNSLAETPQAGWTLTSSSCTNGTPASFTAPATCTFNNTMAEAAPTVLGSNPANGSVGVSVNPVVDVGFNEVLDPTTVTGSTFTLLAGSTPVSGTVSTAEGNSVAVFTPSGALAYGTLYTATITTGVKNTGGTALAVAYTWTFTTGPPPTGSITVVKNAVGADGTFMFTSNFGLTTLTTTGGTASQTFSGLTPGSGYSLNETVPSGWQSSTFCNNESSPSAITVLAGATTTCTVTNTKQGFITVVKNTVGGNGTFAFTSNFGLTSLTTAGNTASQTFSNLPPNGLPPAARRPSPKGPIGVLYSVSEVVPSGWTQTGAVCTNGTPAAVTVAPGATTICTFTNTLQQGSITVVENALGGNGTFAFSSNFGLASLTTAGGTASRTFSGLTPGGSYHVSETAPAGWTQTGASCTSGTPAAVTVTAAATTTCTFTIAQAGSITITENTLGGNGTFAFASNFGLSSLTTIGGTASQTFSGLTPGFNYSVSETMPAGWTETSAVCTAGTPASISVLAGATTTCSITNTQGAAPPAVISTFPANAATLVTTSANVVANFSQLLNPPAMNAITFTLQQGTTPVPGTVTYAGTFATFNPTNNLAPNTQYTATLTSTATTSQPGSYHWSFTTGSAADQTAVCLSNFAVLSGAGIISSGPSTITGDIGVSAGASITGFPPGILTGAMYAGDAASAQGIIDLSAAYANAVARLVGAVPVAGDLGGQTFTSGLYNSVSSLSIISGNLTLDAKGDPNAVFIFQMASTLTTAPGSQIILAGGASASNIFWQVGTSATLGANSVFSGSILANQSITLNTGAAVNGRLLAENGTVTLASNIIASPPPSISVGGFVNAASDSLTAAAGGIVSVFGDNLGSALTTASGYPLPVTLGGSSFQIGTQAAPLYMTSCSQVNLQIPWQASGQVNVTATVGGLVSTGETITLVPFAPGIFSLNQGGSGQGAVEIAATGQLAAPLADAGVPVKRGEYIAIYATGLGPVSNEPATGAAALSDPLSHTLTVPIVTIGGVAATVTYSGLAPGFAGLYQVNALVPDDTPSGNSVNLVLSIGGVQSNTVTIAVQ